MEFGSSDILLSITRLCRIDNAAKATRTKLNPSNCPRALTKSSPLICNGGVVSADGSEGTVSWFSFSSAEEVCVFAMSY